jgi:hypothetical protein
MTVPEVNSSAPARRVPSPLRLPDSATVILGILFIIYAFFLWKSLSRWWFHRDWTTDDAVQQTYPFHDVAHPGLFAGDLITDVMKGYLAALHYWLHYSITWLCGDPIMSGHWVMLIEVLLSTGFLFFAVRHVVGTFPAIFAALWLLHTRHLIQRMTGGLPRG